MNKYLIKEGIRGMFYVKEDGDVDVVDYLSTGINWAYVANEPGIVTYTNKDGSKVEKQVDTNDIVLHFYTFENCPNPIVVIKSKEWIDNIEAKKANALKRAEEMKSRLAGETPQEEVGE